MSDDWRKHCAVWEYESEYKLYMAGRLGMKTAGVIAMAKTMPHYRVVVKDMATLDSLVRGGVQPSQILLTEEYNNTWGADAIEDALWKGDE